MRSLLSQQNFIILPTAVQPKLFHYTIQNKRDFTHHEKGKYNGAESFDVYSQTKLSLIARVTAWLPAIPDTLFFLPAFPFSDYCLKHRKAQFVEYQPEES